MKFSSSLKFNAVSDWWEEYIAYDALKKYIYQLEKQQVSREGVVVPPYSDIEANHEHTSLLGHASNSSPTDALFIPLLDRELKKIVSFYERTEAELLAELEELEKDVRVQDLVGLQGEESYGYEDGDDDDDDEDDDDGSPDVTRRIRRKGSGSRRRGTGVGTSRDPPRRLSLSSRLSIEEDTRGLDESMHSLHRPGVSGSRARKSSGTRALSKLSTTLVNLKDSITSATSPILGSTTSPGGTYHPLSNSLPTPINDNTLNSTRTIWTSPTSYAYDTRLLYKRRITTLYISLTNLRSYVELNYSGFRKVLKKYDKVMFAELKDTYLHEVVEKTRPFSKAGDEEDGTGAGLNGDGVNGEGGRTNATKTLNQAIERLQALYAKCVSRGDLQMAIKQLRLHQRENIAWERDTVWRTMIGRERRGEVALESLGEVGGGLPDAFGASGGPGGGVGNNASLAGATLILPPGPALFTIPLGRRKRLRITKKRVWKLIAFLVLVGMLNADTLKGIRGEDNREAEKCLAVLVFCTVLWASEAIPLFVTSMFVPLLLVTLRVIRAEHGEKDVLSTKEATKYIFEQMFSPTIMLLIGGFTISSALSKTNIDRVIITRVLSLAGTRPSRVLLAFMGVSCFASMWISNVAAPTLCFTLIRPILRTLPPKSPFAPCLILGIALAANIGGQSSPISSPQNLIAMDAMDPKPDWGTWFAISIPVSIISIILIWLFLLVSYRPGRMPPTATLDGYMEEGEEVEIKPIRPTRESFTVKQYWTVLVCVVTIGLWCVEHRIEDVVGDMGVIAIIPVVAFFGTGVLKKDDFDSFMWTIVFLAMGGIALGKGVVSSGLLEIMDVKVRDLVSGYTVYAVVWIMSPIVLIISTFISHTIASVLLVPIAKEVGNNLGGHANVLIFITGLICSTGMGMPVSGFPNQTAATQENELGELYLSNVDFLKNGVPASIIATLVVTTIGYAVMKLVGV